MEGEVVGYATAEAAVREGSYGGGGFVEDAGRKMMFGVPVCRDVP